MNLRSWLEGYHWHKLKLKEYLSLDINKTMIDHRDIFENQFVEYSYWTSCTKLELLVLLYRKLYKSGWHDEDKRSP